MAKQSDETNLKLTSEELRALRTIVTDWINEAIVVAPYDDATASAIAKVGVRDTSAGASASGVRAAPAQSSTPEEQAEPYTIPPAPNLG